MTSLRSNFNLGKLRYFSSKINTNSRSVYTGYVNTSFQQLYQGFKIITIFKITALATILSKIQNDAFIYIK